MWKNVPEFSDYLINEKGSVYRKSTNTVYDYKDLFAFKDDSGLWKNRSINKILNEVFGVRKEKIKATPIQLGESEVYFDTIKEAAIWLIDTKRAITAGKIAAYSTVRTNISLGITHPDLYPYMYGYKWECIKEE